MSAIGGPGRQILEEIAGNTDIDTSPVDIRKVGGTNVTLGQKTQASSFPVVLPSDQVVQVLETITLLGDGRKTVATAGTAEALAASTAVKYVVITAETDNTGVICVGSSTVVAALATRRGIPLEAGDSTVIPIDDLADVYIDTTVNGDGVTYVYYS